MGVKHLNKLIRLNTSEAVFKTSLANITGWTVAIDTSNYLYRFAKDGCMLKGLYNMIKTFKRHSIIPIFVLDGAPPPEKSDILVERRNERYIALYEYNKMKAQFHTNNNECIRNKIQEYKRKSTYVSRRDINNAVTLMELMGVNYIKATGEADQLCSLLTLNGITHACMSEDMDMFVYGTSTILRYLSLVHDNVVVYDYSIILKEMNIPKNDFVTMCILSGSEYNRNYRYDEIISVFDTMNLYKQYRKFGTTIPFVKWIPIYSHNIPVIDMDLFNRIADNYDIINDPLPEFEFNIIHHTCNNGKILDFINKCVK